MHYKNICTICGKICEQCECPGDKVIIDVVCDDCKSEMYHANGVTINEKELCEELKLSSDLSDQKTFGIFIDNPFPFCVSLVTLIKNNINENTEGIITSPLVCVMLVGSNLKNSIDESFVQNCEEFVHDCEKLCEEVLKFEKLQRFGYFKGIPVYRNVYAKTNYITFN